MPENPRRSGVLGEVDHLQAAAGRGGKSYGGHAGHWVAPPMDETDFDATLSPNAAIDQTNGQYRLFRNKSFG